eukprot:10854580-Alexandrium_andersonii.AAC.2
MAGSSELSAKHCHINTKLLQEAFLPLGQLVPVESPHMMICMSELRMTVEEVRKATTAEDVQGVQSEFDMQKDMVGQLAKAMRTSIRSLTLNHKTTEARRLAFEIPRLSCRP